MEQRHLHCSFFRTHTHKHSNMGAYVAENHIRVKLNTIGGALIAGLSLEMDNS